MAHPCLCVPEVLRLIFDPLRPNELLSVGLTCRSFLDPALDKLWHTVPAFAPLIKCLPAGLFETRVDVGVFKLEVVHLRKSRELLPADLQRYLNFYARRIRAVRAPRSWTSKKSCKTIFSAELIQVLGLVTQNQPGVFSPLITKLEWVPDLQEIAAHAFSGYSLYLGPDIQDLLFGVYPNEPTHLASLRYILNRLPTLRTLEIQDKSLSNKKEAPFVHQCGYITSLPWEHLESITIASVPATAIPCLSLLPNLTAICLHDPEIPFLYTSTPRDGDEVPFLSKDRFRSLRSVMIYSDSSFTDAIGFLQYLHPTNHVRFLGVRSYCGDENTSIDYATNARLLLDTIHHHLNPDTLRTLEICDLSIEGVIEPLELDSRAVDISPLFKFINLETVEICLDDGVWLNPALARIIPTAWPKIQSFHLRNRFEGSHVPYIDHTHILDVAYGCPSLRTIRLCFDAGRITAEDNRVPALQRTNRKGDGEGRPRTRLKILMVGAGSPIRSPSSVTSFLVAHFPDLECLDYELSEDDEEREPTKNEERWEAVRQAIRERNGM